MVHRYRGLPAEPRMRKQVLLRLRHSNYLALTYVPGGELLRSVELDIHERAHSQQHKLVVAGIRNPQKLPSDQTSSPRALAC